MLQLEEESIRVMCQDVIAVKPDVVVTEKGISGRIERYAKKTLIFMRVFRCCCSLFGCRWYICCTPYEKIG